MAKKNFEPASAAPRGSRRYGDRQQLSVRLPRPLHEFLKKQTGQSGRSLTGEIEHIVEKAAARAASGFKAWEEGELAASLESDAAVRKAVGITDEEVERSNREKLQAADNLPPRDVAADLARLDRIERGEELSPLEAKVRTLNEQIIGLSKRMRQLATENARLKDELAQIEIKHWQEQEKKTS
jgi:hypothetical protein